MEIETVPLFHRVYRWRRSTAQYDVGHLDRVARMRELTAAQPGLFMCGSAFEGVGVPDCVHQGEQAAARVAQYLVADRSQLGTDEGVENRAALSAEG